MLYVFSFKLFKFWIKWSKVFLAKIDLPFFSFGWPISKEEINNIKFLSLLSLFSFLLFGIIVISGV